MSRRSQHSIMHKHYWLKDEDRTDYESWLRDFGREVAENPDSPEHVSATMRKFAITWVQA